MMAIALGFTEDTSLSEAEYALILKDYGAIEGDNSGDDSIANLNLDRVIKRAEMCKIYNIVIGRSENKLETADGTEVTANTYGFVDVSSDEWYYGDILRATSAYDDNGYVDIAKRGIRNVLDDYT